MSAADEYPHATDLALIPFRFGADRSRARFVLTRQTAKMTHVFDGPDDPQIAEWRQSIARAASQSAPAATTVPAEGGTRG